MATVVLPVPLEAAHVPVDDIHVSTPASPTSQAASSIEELHSSEGAQSTTQTPDDHDNNEDGVSPRSNGHLPASSSSCEAAPLQPEEVPLPAESQPKTSPTASGEDVESDGHHEPSDPPVLDEAQDEEQRLTDSSFQEIEGDSALRKDNSPTGSALESPTGESSTSASDLGAPGDDPQSPAPHTITILGSAGDVETEQPEPRDDIVPSGANGSAAGSSWHEAAPETGSDAGSDKPTAARGPKADGDDDEGEDADMAGDSEWEEDVLLGEYGAPEVVEDPNITRINALEEDNGQLRAALNSQRQEIGSLRSQLATVSTQLASTEQRLMVVSADLATSRSFVSSEDADGAQLLQAFTDLLEAIDDHVYLILDGIGDPPEDAMLSIEAARACTEGPVLRRLQDFVYSALVHRLPLQDFVTLFIQVVVVSVLEHGVFRPFVPGLDGKTSEVLYACYTEICTVEPQDRAARWRSITYSRVNESRDDAKLGNELSDSIFTALETSLPALLPDCDEATIAGLRKQFTGASLKLIRDALRLRDLCMKVYLSIDYTLTFPPSGSRILNNKSVKLEETLNRCLHSQPIHPELTENADGGNICVAVLAPGLTASKNKQRPGGKEGDVERNINTLRKPGIIVAKCKWASSHSIA